MSAKKEVHSLIFLSFLILLSFVLFNGCATTKDINSEIIKKELLEVHNIIENNDDFKSIVKGPVIQIFDDHHLMEDSNIFNSTCWRTVKFNFPVRNYHRGDGTYHLHKIALISIKINSLKIEGDYNKNYIFEKKPDGEGVLAINCEDYTLDILLTRGDHESAWCTPDFKREGTRYTCSGYRINSSVKNYKRPVFTIPKEDYKNYLNLKEMIKDLFDYQGGFFHLTQTGVEKIVNASGEELTYNQTEFADYRNNYFYRGPLINGQKKDIPVIPINKQKKDIPVKKQKKYKPVIPISGERSFWTRDSSVNKKTLPPTPLPPKVIPFARQGFSLVQTGTCKFKTPMGKIEVGTYQGNAITTDGRILPCTNLNEEAWETTQNLVDGLTHGVVSLKTLNTKDELKYINNLFKTPKKYTENELKFFYSYRKKKLDEFFRIGYEQAEKLRIAKQKELDKEFEKRLYDDLVNKVQNMKGKINYVAKINLEKSSFDRTESESINELSSLNSKTKAILTQINVNRGKLFPKYTKRLDDLELIVKDLQLVVNDLQIKYKGIQDKLLREKMMIMNRTRQVPRYEKLKMPGYKKSDEKLKVPVYPVYKKSGFAYKSLATFYTTYSTLKRCHESGFVDFFEMEKIKSNAKKIETGIIKKYPELNSQKDLIWNDATKPVSVQQATLLLLQSKPVYGTILVTSDYRWREMCRSFMSTYETLIFGIEYAGEGGTVKDF